MSGPLLNRRRLVAGFALVVVLAASFWAWQGARRGQGPLPAELQDFLLWQPVALQPFALQHAGAEPLGLEALRGRWTFLFFGYTQCPDVCPGTMAVLAQAFRLIEGQAGALPAFQGWFVSVDPQRDRPEALAEYVQFFHPRLVGATATATELEALSRQFSVTYSIQAPAAPAAGGSYLVAHSAAVFLIDPQGRLLARFAPPQEATEMAKVFAQIRSYYDERIKKSWGWF